MDLKIDGNVKDYVNGLVKKARIAQQVAELFSQEKVDELVAAVAWTIVKEKNARELARLAMEETQLGDYESKYKKILKKIKGVLDI